MKTNWPWLGAILLLLISAVAAPPGELSGPAASRFLAEARAIAERHDAAALSALQWELGVPPEAKPLSVEWYAMFFSTARSLVSVGWAALEPDDADDFEYRGKMFRLEPPPVRRLDIKFAHPQPQADQSLSLLIGAKDGRLYICMPVPK